MSIYEHFFMNLKTFVSEIKKHRFLYLILILFLGIVFLTSFRSPEKDGQQGEYITMRIYENFTGT